MEGGGGRPAGAAARSGKRQATSSISAGSGGGRARPSPVTACVAGEPRGQARAPEKPLSQSAAPAPRLSREHLRPGERSFGGCLCFGSGELVWLFVPCPAARSAVFPAAQGQRFPRLPRRQAHGALRRVFLARSSRRPGSRSEGTVPLPWPCVSALNTAARSRLRAAPLGQ